MSLKNNAVSIEEFKINGIRIQISENGNVDILNPNSDVWLRYNVSTIKEYLKNENVYLDIPKEKWNEILNIKFE